MKKSITISIPEPCHEDWAKMTPTEKGRFCSVCTKEVIDFTQVSDESLIKRIQKGDDLCGRFVGSQLDRPMSLQRKSRNSILPYAASLLFPLSLLGHQEAKSQGGASVFNKAGISLNIGANSEKSIVTITGQVTDESGIPIPGVEVLVIETGSNAWTDFDGNYTLRCPSGSTLSFLSEDKKPHEVTVGTQNSVIHAVLVGEPTEIFIQPHILGKIAPIETVEVIEETKKNSTEITISGTITDENGLPLPFVNVIEEGTSNGTQTDFDGKYQFKAMPNQTLVFSYLSYTTREVRLSNISNDISFSMEPNDEILGEIVIVGIVVEEEFISSPTEREASWDEEQWENQRERQTQSAKENAFKKIQMERSKEARKLKRERRRKK